MFDWAANKPLLEKLWAEGLPASEIAARFGGITKNAVLGAVHRMKLPPRRLAYTFNGAASPRNTPMTSRALRFAKYMPGVAPLVKRARVLLPSWRNMTEPASKLVTIYEVTECRWPTSVNEKGEDVFCNHARATDSSYCAYHKSKSVQ